MARILCVDDEPAAAQLKCSILERAGHQAIAYLRAEQFDAVVTDWRLGEESARAVVEAAKERFHVPVVVVSGFVAEAFHAPEPAADLYLEKPVNADELVTIIQTLLGRGKTSG